MNDERDHDNRPISEHDEIPEALLADLAAEDGPAEDAGVWPARLWEILLEAKAPLWSIPSRHGGLELSRERLVKNYALVAAGSLAAAFVLSQYDAGVRRLAVSRRPVASLWLDRLAQGLAFTTVGISHLTTSRRLGDQALRAVEIAADRYRLDGAIPWVTAAERADVLVTGAPLPDGRRLLLALPTDRRGFSVRPPFSLAALPASVTSEAVCEGVEVTDDDLLTAPAPDVMEHASAAGTGGLETSALALGQSLAALRAIETERLGRDDLAEPLEALRSAFDSVETNLLAIARGVPNAPNAAEVRIQANDLVLRLTQAYLTVRKGTGFLRSDPAQRWARQALFFLVWSCPSPVAAAAIRERARLVSN